jgi:CHASE2 domain-containing sensor protein
MTRRTRVLLLAGLVPASLAALLCLIRPLALYRIELAAYDLVLRAAPVSGPGGRVVIVDVDDRSLARVGQWPWRRDVMARLVTRLRDAGAASVALDIIFAEPDRGDAPEAPADAALAQALAGGRVLLGYGMTFAARDGGHGEAPPETAEACHGEGCEPAETTGGCVLHPLPVAVLGAFDAAPSPYFAATGAICSLPLLTSAAGASGFLNAAPDPDGVLRRAPVLIELAGRVHPSLGLAAVASMEHRRDLTLHVTHDTASTLVASRGHEAGDAGALRVPLDGRGNMLLRYRGRKGTFTYVSATDVLDGRVAPDAFRDKLVLVGTTALGTREVVSTPLDTLFTGVEVQATIADNILQRDFLARPSSAVLIEAFAVLLFAAAAAVLILRAGFTWGVMAAALLLPLPFIGAVGLLAASGVVLSPLFPTLGMLFGLSVTTIAGLTLERRRADREGRDHAAARRLMIQTLLSLTEIRDAETGSHSRRTQLFTRVLAQELARHSAYASFLTPDRIDLLATLAPLHDIGKVGVPDAVLNKPGRLTDEEMAEMRKHPAHGRDVILNAERATGVRDDATLEMAKAIVYTHHEKWDGSGYPEGLRGEAIPIPGRVLAVVDVYDACTMRRLYASPMSHEEVVALIVRGRGVHFDPAVVDAFLAVAPVFRSLADEATTIASAAFRGVERQAG